jgi:hypothetical protein
MRPRGGAWFFTAACCLLLGASLGLAQPKSELRPPPPLDPVKAVSEARALVANLLALRPDSGSTNTGVLRIRPRDSASQKIPVRIEIASSPTNWTTLYQTLPPDGGPPPSRLLVVHTIGQSNQYLLSEPADGPAKPLAGPQVWTPFAGTDFFVGDLGLDFLQWPQQRFLRKELRRGQSCGVLESTNPQPAAGGYARVVSWVDLDNGGIVHAEAFDARNDLLKEFDPTAFKKIQGQHQLEEMEMRNRQTGSRTWIKFNIGSE